MNAGYTPLFPGLLYDSAERFAREQEQQSVASTSLIDLGWVLSLLPEALGGIGGALSDVAAIAEALGQYDVGLPLAEVCVVAPYLLASIEDEALRSQWQKQLAESNVRVAPLLDPAGRVGSGHLQVRNVSDASILSGTAFAPADFDATHLALVAHAETGLQFMLIEVDAAQASASVVTSVDGRSLRKFVFDDVQLASSSCLVKSAISPEKVVFVNNAHLLVELAAMIGRFAGLIQQTVTHLNERKQFGVALSSFQVLRHRVAEMYVKYLAGWALVKHCYQEWDSPSADLERTLSIAKLSLSESARFCAEAAIQSHGGMGMSEEVMATRIARALLTREYFLGDRLEHAYRLSQSRA